MHRLDTIPAEIRRNIYEQYLACGEVSYHVVFLDADYNRNSRPDPQFTVGEGYNRSTWGAGILGVSRLIREELIPVICSERPLELGREQVHIAGIGVIVESPRQIPKQALPRLYACVPKDWQKHIQGLSIVDDRMLPSLTPEFHSSLPQLQYFDTNKTFELPDGFRELPSALLENFTASAFNAGDYTPLLVDRCLDVLREFLLQTPIYATKSRPVEIRADILIGTFHISRPERDDAVANDAGEGDSDSEGDSDGEVGRMAAMPLTAQGNLDDEEHSATEPENPYGWPYPLADPGDEHLGNILRCHITLPAHAEFAARHCNISWDEEYQKAERYYLAEKDNEKLIWKVEG
ncbi:uncharacterized protein AB675_391 [Cyphellophora attinorum]|uniref:Uncharacterized protein n=1 Tax=Cyphellophora attinorum TaxID=1664694 RepID=A0A0N1HI93_9EURO|nr:uncharacterized protein AB675_391 [Phialophora attinorum]KPI45990.1 hypothetical protein AB675_391 [Phialophora attinorum]